MVLEMFKKFSEILIINSVARQDVETLKFSGEYPQFQDCISFMCTCTTHLNSSLTILYINEQSLEDFIHKYVRVFHYLSDTRGHYRLTDADRLFKSRELVEVIDELSDNIKRYRSILADEFIIRFCQLYREAYIKESQNRKCAIIRTSNYYVVAEIRGFEFIRTIPGSVSTTKDEVISYIKDKGIKSSDFLDSSSVVFFEEVLNVSESFPEFFI